MTPHLIANYATPGRHTACVVVGRDATGIAPSSALAAHAPDAARYGVRRGVTA